jgi:hypothetical protein
MVLELMNCNRGLVALYARLQNSSMRKGLCAEVPS